MNCKSTTAIRIRPVPAGTLLLIGELTGEDDLSALVSTQALARMSVILKCFMKLIRVRKPVIEVITCGGLADPVGTYWQLARRFAAISPCTVNHIHTFAQAQHCPDDLRRRIMSADGVLFADGDQLKIAATYSNSNLFELIRHRYLNDQIVVAGLNAGAMALSTLLISSQPSDREEPLNRIRVTTGLQLLKNVCVDTRFPCRGRIERMATVLEDNPEAIGLSIHKDTALIIRKGTETTTVGYGAVIITNPVKSSAMAPDAKKYLQVQLLSDGEQYTFDQTA